MEELLKVHHGKFSVGDDITYADLFIVSLIPIFERLSLCFDDYPILAEIKSNIEELEVYKASHPSKQPGFDPNMQL